jgi:hypothetical protein
MADLTSDERYAEALTRRRAERQKAAMSTASGVSPTAKQLAEQQAALDDRLCGAEESGERCAQRTLKAFGNLMSRESYKPTVSPAFEKFLQEVTALRSGGKVLMDDKGVFYVG